jgi:hypothetical protein
MPPPVAPPPAFQTTSRAIAPSPASSRVPPHAVTHGLAAGKSTCAAPSGTSSFDPLSPEAQNTETPSSAASWKASSNARRDAAVQLPASSGLPQLIDTTDGRRRASWTAVVIASRNPSLRFGAK